MFHLSGSNLVVGLNECSLFSHVNMIRDSWGCVSPIESYHDIRLWSKSMHARIQCFSLILTGISILEHVKISMYLVSLALRMFPSIIYFQKKGVAKKVFLSQSIFFGFRLPCLVIE